MRVAVRADAAATIGSGHVMRCLTLADELASRGAEVVFVTREHPGHLIDIIRARGHRACVLPSHGPLGSEPGSWLPAGPDEDARDTRSALADEAPLDWLVVDHYALGAPWHEAVRSLAQRLLAIDDLADRPLAADLVLNQNYGTDTEAYAEHSPGATVLAGPAFALLGAQYRSARAQIDSAQGGRARAPRAGERTNLLISLGGSDPGNATGAVLEALVPLLPVLDHVHVVVGRHQSDLATLRRRCGRHRNLALHVQTDRMAELLLRNDLAIGAGGSSTWERLCLGVPTITLPLADNQRPTARALHQAGLIELAPDDWRAEGALASAVVALASDAARRSELARRGMRLVDGAGAERVANTLLGA